MANKLDTLAFYDKLIATQVGVQRKATRSRTRP
jgi:hypothetical protein